MPTNLNIDDKLLNRVKRLGKHKTKREAVNAALENYQRQFDLQKLFGLFGTIDFHPDYDYRKMRGKSASIDRQPGVVSHPAPQQSRRRGTGTRKAA